MKKNLSFVCLLSICYFTSCNDEPQRAEPAPANEAVTVQDTTPKTDTTTQSTDVTEVKTTVTSTTGENLDLTFTQNAQKEDILKILKNGETIELKAEPTASGIRYKNQNYEYQEHQGEIILIKDGKTIFKANENPDQAISASTKTKLKYTQAENYFVRNDFDLKQLKNARITNQKDFDAIVGGAAYQGEGGRPTPINWATSDVIVVIDKISDRNPVMSIVSATEQDGTITVEYSIQEYAKTTFSMQPIKVLMIDKKNKSKVVVVKK